MTALAKDWIGLREKANETRIATLRLHGSCPETRLASSLSCVEILCTLFYCGLIKHNPMNPYFEERDRFIISKGHGSISFYPILADLGFFAKEELGRISKVGSLLKAIPDTLIPGYETINGSVGQGLGTACGITMALRLKKSLSKVYVLCGDGELHEGSMWEGIMCAAHHRLDSLTLIVDQNKRCMLGWSDDYVNLSSLEERFKIFGWDVASADGHSMESVHDAICKLHTNGITKPKVVVAHTIKGKGVPRLEADPLCHIRTLSAQEIDKAIEDLS